MTVMTIIEVLRDHGLPGLHIVQLDTGRYAARDENEVWRSHAQDTPLLALRQALNVTEAEARKA